MNTICWIIWGIAVLFFLIAVYLFAFRRTGTTWKSRGSVLVVFLVLLLLGWSVRTSQIFGAHNWLTKWLLGHYYDSTAFNSITNEWRYEHAQAEYLGRYVKENRSGKKCVIVRGPLLLNSIGEPSVNPLVDGFKAGISDELEIVKEIEVPMSVEEVKEPVFGSYQREWTAEKLTTMLSEAGEYDLLVACLPLPADFEAPGKELVLVSGYNAETTREGLFKGSVLAAVTYKSKVDYGKACPEDVGEAFKERYELITKERLMVKEEDVDGNVVK